MRKFITIALLILTSLNLHAIPLGNVFTYQGELTEAGQPANGAYTFNAHFYDAPSGGNLVDSHLNIIATVTNGLFSLPLDITSVHFQGEEIWIELEIVIVIRGTGANETLLPRQLITTTPYAIQAYFVSANGVNEDSIQNEVVSTTKLANGAVTNAKLDVSSVSSSNIINETIDTDDIKNGSIMAVDINTASVQQRVAGSCTAGNSIRAIAANGTVTCEPDSMGTSGWGLTGNAGTTPGTDFVGTTDNTAFEVKVNNLTAVKVQPRTGTAFSSPNITLGHSNNLISSFLEGSLIGGGAGNSITSTNDSGYNVVMGGYSNTISGTTALNYATILGGAANQANATLALASGFGAKANHLGSWVWSDYSDTAPANGVTTTADNQFLIRAEGGFGLGTNAPTSPMHIKGQGTSTGSTTSSNEVVMTIEPKVSTDGVAMVINKLDTTEESALMFSTNSSPEFDIRTVNGGAMDFNSYDAGTPTFMMRIQNKATDRIDFNTNIEPQINNTYTFGSSSYRWEHIYTNNITTSNPIVTDSDKRLKNNISDLNYGLAEVLTMRPVSYNLKKDEEKQVLIGLIAQELELIVPEVVHQTSDEKQMRSVSYSELIPVLIKATQEQQTLIDQQSQQIKSLQAMVNTLLENNK